MFEFLGFFLRYGGVKNEGKEIYYFEWWSESKLFSGEKKNLKQKWLDFKGAENFSGL